MISLEQIRLLEARVVKAVELINALKAENSSLRKTIDSAQSRVQDLERLVGDLKTDQREIERGILRAIENLDQLEDEVLREEGLQEEVLPGPDGAPKQPGKRSASPPPPAPERLADSPVEDTQAGEAGEAGAEEQELDIF